MPVIFYFCYVVGTWVLGVPEQAFNFQLSWEWVANSIETIGPAFLLGCGVLGIIFAILGYFGIQLLWRYSVIKQWNKRKEKRLKK